MLLVVLYKELFLGGKRFLKIQFIYIYESVRSELSPLLQESYLLLENDSFTILSGTTTRLFLTDYMRCSYHLLFSPAWTAAVFTAIQNKTH